MRNRRFRPSLDVLSSRIAPSGIDLALAGPDPCPSPQTSTSLDTSPMAPASPGEPYTAAQPCIATDQLN